MLRVGDRVVFGGDAHTVVAISGATIRLLSSAKATTVVALPYLLAAEDFELVGAAPALKVAPHSLLEALPDQVVAAAWSWQRRLGSPPACGRCSGCTGATTSRDWGAVVDARYARKATPTGHVDARVVAARVGGKPKMVSERYLGTAGGGSAARTDPAPGIRGHGRGSGGCWASWRWLAWPMR